MRSRIARKDCPVCKGKGRIKSDLSVGYYDYEMDCPVCKDTEGV